MSDEQKPERTPRTPEELIAFILENGEAAIGPTADIMNAVFTEIERQAHEPPIETAQRIVSSFPMDSVENAIARAAWNIRQAIRLSKAGGA